MTPFDLSLDPETQDLRFDDDAGDFEEAVSPGLEAVKRVVGTERGACPLVPDEGIDWSPVRRGAPNASASVRRVLLDALGPLVRERVIDRLEVEARATLGTGGSARYAYTVTFDDVQTGAAERQDGVF
jgi:hypothetical protein